MGPLIYKKPQPQPQFLPDHLTYPTNFDPLLVLFMSPIICNYPSELLDVICSQIFVNGLPPVESSLDPIITTNSGVPTAYPSSTPQAYWPEPVVRCTLASLCLVNHAWYEAAKPWLWRR